MVNTRIVLFCPDHMRKRLLRFNTGSSDHLFYRKILIHQNTILNFKRIFISAKLAVIIYANEDFRE